MNFLAYLIMGPEPSPVRRVARPTSSMPINSAFRDCAMRLRSPREAYQVAAEVFGDRRDVFRDRPPDKQSYGNSTIEGHVPLIEAARGARAGKFVPSVPTVRPHELASLLRGFRPATTVGESPLPTRRRRSSSPGGTLTPGAWPLPLDHALSS